MGARVRRRQRRLQHAEFERVYKQGRRHFAAHMTVFYLPRTQGTGLRVGFTVGRALGGAVVRNRIRRRLREAVRLRWPASPAAADIVVHAKKSALKAGFEELLREMERALAVVGQKTGPRAQS